MTMTSKTNPLRENLLLQAAQRALDRGWYVFGTTPHSKIPFKGTHWNKDAVNDETALRRWETNPDANPCVYLKPSGLTVLDADHGLTSLEHAEAWAKANGIPATYIVQSGRVGGGFHFYFRGVRTLPDVTRNPKAGRVGFILDGVVGDIKCNGYVVLAGGLHKSGARYTGNGRERDIAALPEIIRDYRDPKDIKVTERLAAQAKRRAEKSGPAQTPQLLTHGDGLHDRLLRDAGRLRWFGLNEDAIYLGLKDIATRFFENGANYNDGEIRRLAHDVAAKPCDRLMTATSPNNIQAPEPTKRSLIAQLLRRVYPVGSAPVSIHSIMGSIAKEYGSPSKGTLGRALDDVKFTPAGKDPVDRRKFLWVRKVEEL
jgi:Bifunctional DNA primase/polymerase, N-terminal